jgi:hypothetical protein
MNINEKTFKLDPNGGFGKKALIAGIIGVIISIAGLVANKGYFFHSYLTSWAFCSTIGLGGLFFVMLHHLVNATWSVVVRRIAENVMSTLLMIAPFFIPVLFGLHDLYHWTHADIVAADPLLQGKAPYLNIEFFIVRALVYIGAWMFLVWRLYKLSITEDKDFDSSLPAKMRKLCAPGMLIFAATITFSSFDWYMSLDAHWYSTIFGVYIFGGAVISSLSFITLITIYLRQKGLLADIISFEHFHDLGKLMFAFTVFWGYIAFAQYFLIWYANIPEETIWYHARWAGSWQFFSLVLIFGHFVLPFMVLISRGAKRNLKTMKIMAIWLLIMHWVDLYWVIMPNFTDNVWGSIWIDLGTMLTISGFGLWYLWKKLASQPVIPINDPKLEASINLVSD